MPTRLSPAEFDETADLADWRYVLGGIEATFHAPSFGAAARFVDAIALVADASNHHPDIDLRYPGVVRIWSTTHSAGGLTDLDLALARDITDLAASASFQADPGAAERVEVAIDAIDIAAIRPFWLAVLGYVDADPESDGTVNDIVDPLRIGPALWFQQMDEPRPQRNRLHLDVSVPHDQAEARVAAAIAAGGTLVSDLHARSFWVLADAEGNEACVCTWQDRERSGD